MVTVIFQRGVKEDCKKVPTLAARGENNVFSASGLCEVMKQCNLMGLGECR